MYLFLLHAFFWHFCKFYWKLIASGFLAILAEIFLCTHIICMILNSWIFIKISFVSHPYEPLVLVIPLYRITFFFISASTVL